MKTRSMIPLLLAIILASCTANGGTIYYVLEHEVKQPETGLGPTGTTLTVFDLATDGSKYYLAAGKVWSSPVGPVANLAWTSLTNPPPANPKEHSLCVTMAAFNPGAGVRLYGGFNDAHGTGMGIYSFAAGGSFAAAPDVITGIPAGDQIARLVSSGGQLFAITSTPGTNVATPFTYNLYSSTDGVAFTALLTGLTSPINDATFVAGAPGTYYAVSGSTLYSGTASPLTGTSTLGSFTISDVLQSVVWDGTNLWLTAKSSGLYFFSALTWYHVAADTTPTGTLNSFLETSPLSFAPGKALAGSDGFGYYVVDFTAPGTPILTRYLNLSLALYVSSARRFLVDTVNTTVLAGTNGGGLWAGTLSTTATDPQLIVSGWLRQ